MECKTGGMVFALVMLIRFHYFGKMETKVALASLAALAHATRLAAFRLLVEAGTEGRMAGEIAEALDVPAATLSFHLRELTLAGLVDSEQRGRFVCYRANFAGMNALIEYLTRNCCAGTPGTQCFTNGSDCC